MEMMRRFLICFFLLIFILCGCANIEKKDISSNQYINQNEEMNKSDDIVEEAEEKKIENNSSIADKIIVIDAGHGINSYNKQEPIAPNSSETKIAFASGTSGVNQTEEQLNLSVALKLQKVLEDKGAIVHMTRTEHETDMTNVDRAVFANELNADISVKIHADGNNSNSIHGVSVLVPGTQYIEDSYVIERSKVAGELILDAFVKETGATNRGISVRNDLTGFNWTKVPIVLVEMGFMTNLEEDRRMETEEYQDKMVQGIALGLEKYFENTGGK